MSAEEINQDSIVCWSSAPVATQVNDEVVLMNLERDRCYGLGNTGSDIWRRLSAPIKVSELSTQLEQEYDSTPGQIEADVLRTLKEFAAEGLIQVHPASE
jgi:Coenzyme PQQ synthesis protein D (PqqD)